ncbi:hypothetical protein KAI68_03390, partial [bacterium]|nr:hypothetical protein [bacterium]
MSLIQGADGKYRSWIKIVAGLTLSFFIATFLPNYAYAQVSMLPQAIPSDMALKEVMINPEKLKVPTSFGKIVDTHCGKGDKLLIYIQDLHTNYEVQTNIYSILENLTETYDLKIVATEGTQGEIDTSLLSTFPLKKVKKEVVEFFMRKGEITGPECLSIMGQKPPILYGVEKKELYLKNLGLYKSSLDSRKKLRESLISLDKIIKVLQQQIYSPEILGLVEKVSLYQKNEISVVDFVGYLQERAKDTKINIEKRFKNLAILIKLIHLRQKLNSGKSLQIETMAIVSRLYAVMNVTEIRGLTRRSQESKDLESYYLYLENLAKKYKVDLKYYFPYLASYFEYMELSRGLNSVKLVEEQIKLVDELINFWCRNKEEREIIHLSKVIETMKKFIDIKMTGWDIEYYLKNKKFFDRDRIINFLKKEIKKYRKEPSSDTPPDALPMILGRYDLNKLNDIPDFKEVLTTSEEYYATAVGRNKFLLENSLKKMEAEENSVIALVTGGFHTPGITKLAKEKGLSYVVVSPNVTQAVDSKRYFALLEGKETPYKDLLLEQSELLLALASKFIGKEFTRKIAFLITNSLIKMYKNKDWSMEDIKTEIENVFNRTNVENVENSKFQFQWVEELTQKDTTREVYSFKVFENDTIKNEGIKSILASRIIIEGEKRWETNFIDSKEAEGNLSEIKMEKIRIQNSLRGQLGLWISGSINFLKRGMQMQYFMHLAGRVQERVKQQIIAQGTLVNLVKNTSALLFSASADVVLVKEEMIAEVPGVEEKVGEVKVVEAEVPDVEVAEVPDVKVVEVPEVAEKVDEVVEVVPLIIPVMTTRELGNVSSLYQVKDLYQQPLQDFHVPPSTISEQEMRVEAEQGKILIQQGKFNILKRISQARGMRLEGYIEEYAVGKIKGRQNMAKILSGVIINLFQSLENKLSSSKKEYWDILEKISQGEMDFNSEEFWNFMAGNDNSAEIWKLMRSEIAKAYGAEIWAKEKNISIEQAEQEILKEVLSPMVDGLTEEIKADLRQTGGEFTDSILYKAQLNLDFAYMIDNAAFAKGLYEVQDLAAAYMAKDGGSFVEVRTGGGKTLIGMLPAYLIALKGET